MGKDLLKLRMGMIGGGKGAFIGAIHRMAAALDGHIELCCGVFNSDSKVSRDFGRSLGLPDDRIYDSYQQMMDREAALPAEKRMHFVSIVTPNHLHFDPAMAALKKGFHVVVEKPMCFDLQEAKMLSDELQKTDLRLALTHTYAGYPMVKEARQIIQDGRLGNIRKVWVEYPQGWLSSLTEKQGNQQAVWRTDPKKSGKAGAMGDIGSHAAHLVEYVTGKKILQLCADIETIVEGRLLDDDGAALLKLEGGISGVLVATQVAAGEENDLKIRVYGEKGGLEWCQRDANSLILKWLDAPSQILRAGNGYLSETTRHNCRTPPGHPEGYIEAFANIYRNFALTLLSELNGQVPEAWMLDFPTVHEGVRGMAFIDKIIESGNSDQKWLDLPLN